MDIYISTSLNRLMKCFYRTTVASFGTATAKPLRKGRMLKDSGFIESVQDGVTETGDYLLLQGHVHNSMKRLQPLVSVWSLAVRVVT